MRHRTITAVVALFAFLILCFGIVQFAHASTVTPIFGGGTGTSTAPSYGKVLIGDSNGNYELTATSSLGFPAGGSGTVTSVQLGTPNSSLTITGMNPITTNGTINADINFAHANIFTALQWFTQNASTSQLTATSTVWFTGYSSAALTVDGNGKVTAYGGTTCTNQVLTALSAALGSTCSSINNGYWSGAALTIANGGTGTTTAPAGQLIYGGGAGVYQSVATSSVSQGTAISISGSGALVGGSGLTINFSAPASSALSIPYASSTMASLTTASTTNLTVSSIRSALIVTGAGGAASAYGGASACTNQFVTTISALGGTTCASVNNADWSGTQLSVANGGTNDTSLTGDQFLYTNHAGTSVLTAASSTLDLPNTALQNSSLTINTISYLLSGGGSVSLGGTLNLNASTSPTVGYVDATSTTASFLNYASTTVLSAAGPIYSQDTQNNYTGKLTPTHTLMWPFATSTATWTATSTPGIDTAPTSTLPFTGTIKQVRCYSSTFLGIRIEIGNTPITPSYFVASGTVGVETVTGNNTFSAGNTITVLEGTTSSATATAGVAGGSCSIDMTQT